MILVWFAADMGSKLVRHDVRSEYEKTDGGMRERPGYRLFALAW